MNKLNKLKDKDNLKARLWKIKDGMYAGAQTLSGKDVISLTIVNEIADPIVSAELLQQLGAAPSSSPVWVEQALREAEVHARTRQVFLESRQQAWPEGAVKLKYPLAALDVAKLLQEPKYLEDFLDAIDTEFQYPDTMFAGNQDDDNEDFIGVFVDILKTERLGREEAEALWQKGRSKALAVCAVGRHTKIKRNFDALKSLASGVSQYLMPLSSR
tara:strand:- start:1190 stop:1834 length:645 start_codon:yes stop_codon:yes gene_type:complete